LAYLSHRNLLTVIDANNNRLITAQELQTFQDQAAATGLPEAGALARFLGGNARPPGERPIVNAANNALTVTASNPVLGLTAALEQPDQPDVLQRRYNFLDYAADGQLNGSISFDQLTVLAHTLLPPPDSFVITDRQRASANNYLLEAHAGRNISELQHILTSYAFVPARAVRRFRNLSPARFHVGQRVDPQLVTPLFTLFEPPANRGVRASRAPRRVPTQAPTTGQGSSSTATPTATTGTPSSSSTPAPSSSGTTGDARADALGP
jgi:hypothetical protein